MKISVAKRNITGRHGQTPPPTLDFSKPGRLARWLSKHPMRGITTPARTPEYKLLKRQRFREIVETLARLGRLR